jgi:ferredoxin
VSQLRAIVDPDKCQGFAACVRAAPTVFSLGLDQIAEVDSAALVDRDHLIRAAKSCPFAAVALIDEAVGTQIYPAPPGAARGSTEG